MTENYLCLNDSKTEFLILGGKADLEKVKINQVTVGKSKKKPRIQPGTSEHILIQIWT